MFKAKKTKTVVEKDRTPIQLTLPLFHLQVLAAEAEQWGVGRGEFLTMLLRRKFGDLQFERPKVTPVPKLTKDALAKSDRYMWYLPTRDVERLRADCLKVGNLSPSMWVLLALNEWMNAEDAKAALRQTPEMVNAGYSPDEKTPAEPYWGLFAVDEEGRSNGGIWTLEGDVVLFMDDHVAAKVAKNLRPPPKVKGAKDAVAWAVRGVSRRCLEGLQGAYPIRTVLGVLRDPELRKKLRRVQQLPEW